MDNNQHVTLPAEDFRELQTVAYNQPTPTGGERLASTAQTTIVFVAIAGAVTLGSYGWASAMDWLEERRLKRQERKVSLTSVK